MKKTILLLGVLGLIPVWTQAASISGCLYNDEQPHSPGTPIDGIVVGAEGNTYVDLINPETFETSVYQVEVSGCYTIDPVPSEFLDKWINVNALPPNPPIPGHTIFVQAFEQIYVIEEDTVTDFDFYHPVGGDVSGLLTTEEAPIENQLAVTVYEIDQNGDPEVAAWTFNIEELGTTSFPYLSQAVEPGEYFVKFEDYSGQFQDEWYGNYPGHFYPGGTQSVTVSRNATTTNIDASLHSIYASQDRYYIGYAGAGTNYIDQVGKNSTSNGGVSLFRFTGEAVPIDDITSYTVVGPPAMGNCTNSNFDTNAQARITYTDKDDDGGTGDGFINRPDEKFQINHWFETNLSCEFDVLGHEAGAYQFTATFSNGNAGQPLTTTITDIPAALTETELPTVAGLAAEWNHDERSLTVRWDALEWDDLDINNFSNLEIRIVPYLNGHKTTSSLRVKNLPPDIISFTFDEAMTALINNGQVDQIQVRVRMVGENRTKAMTRRYYDFDYMTSSETLTEAPLRMKLLDVNGDGKTGVAESIYSLQQVVSP